MNGAFKQVIMASGNDRRTVEVQELEALSSDLFLSSANRLGTTAQYVEKDS